MVAISETGGKVRPERQVHQEALITRVVLAWV